MANKRTLKRDINQICSTLFAECIAASEFSTTAKKENVDALLSSIIMIHNNYIMRVSHPEPGMEAKTYYKDLLEKFYKQISEIADQISNLV